MPEPYPILNSLMLEQTGENRFRGPSVPSDFRPVVFGGQLMGQMIVAAAATLPDKNVKSLHAIFARAGTVQEPVDLDVDVMHAGRALASLTVTARQGDRLLSRGLLLLDAGEPDLIRHSLPMPKVAGPGDAEARGWPDGGSQVRIVDGVDLMTTEVTGDPELNVWVKFDHAPPSQAVHQALLSWYTDPFLIAASMRPHPGIGQSMSHEVISTGVITHTLSFHEPIRADGWLLLAQHSLVAGHGRTYGSGQVFDERGTQVASFVQENLVRAFRSEPGTRGKATMAM
jgi:acyl-CoA thioesterase II